MVSASTSAGPPPAQKLAQPKGNLKPAAFYVPVRFNAGHYQGEWCHYLYYFLNLLHWKWICWQADDHGFIRLKHDYLTRVIPKSIWPAMRARLEQEGIVEWDRHFLPGEYCYGYRLSPDYRKTQRIECSDRAFSRRLHHLQTSQQRTLLPVHKWLGSKLRLLDFNFPQAQAVISSMTPDADSRMTTDEYRLLLTESCQKFLYGDLELSCDRFGRVHTPVTNLPRELRSCLSVNGQKLVEIDLANSQPLIAGLCARQFYRSSQCRSRLLKKPFSGRTNPYCYREIDWIHKQAEKFQREHGCYMTFDSHGNPAVHRNNQENSSPEGETSRITTGSKSQVPAGAGSYGGAQLSHNGDRSSLPFDLQNYLMLCEQGLLYDSLLRPGADRDEIKREMFRDVFFGMNSLRSALKNRFCNQFPSVAGMLRTLKQENYRLSSWVMQNYEATVCIYQIGNRLRNERPDLAVFTIHDSVLVVPEEADYVTRVIQEEFGKLEIQPTLRTKGY